jgi:hypothetical protein
MTTLSHRTPLRTLAGILRAAAALGPDAWKSPADRSSTAPGSVDALSTDLLALFTILRDRQIPHLLVGGVALLKYIDGRNTDNIDLIIAVESLANLPEIIIEDRNPDSATARFRSLRVIRIPLETRARFGACSGCAF